MGFTTKPGSEGQELTNGVAYSAQEEAKLIEVQDFAQRMGEKELTFNYNGKSKTITLPSAEEIRKNLGSDNGLTYVKDKLQESMDAAFGKGRVTVNLEDVVAGDASKGQRLTLQKVARYTHHLYLQDHNSQYGKAPQGRYQFYPDSYGRLVIPHVFLRRT